MKDRFVALKWRIERSEKHHHNKRFPVTGHIWSIATRNDSVKASKWVRDVKDNHDTNIPMNRSELIP